jgi:hypothetical protein
VVDTGGNDSIGFIIFSSETDDSDLAVWTHYDTSVVSMVVEDDGSSIFDVTFTVAEYSSSSQGRHQSESVNTCL